MSNIATTIEQSVRLIRNGIDPLTADMYYETLEDGVFSAVLKLNMYIDENYRDYQKKLEKI